MYHANKAILVLFWTLGASSFAFAQLPDLVVPSGSFSPSPMKAGELLTINAVVQNTGNAAAGASHLAFWVSPTPGHIDAVYFGVTSVEPLEVGALSGNVSYIFPLPYSISPGIYYIGFYADYYHEVTESSESNSFYLPATQLTVTAGIISSLHLPYPIIFIHGLNSNDATWDELSIWLSAYGWSNGGTMNFCLNLDSNLTTGLFANDYRDFTDSVNQKPADFYFVNFDVNPNGAPYNNTVQSNQSAAVKQGWAVHDAISHVLKATKSEKVVLVGHSMGGLAAREYLQDVAKWQNDGKHHIAKLLTLGTPHGGSNASTFGVLDGYSEAIRDLRWSYSNGAAGVYLFGGNENNKAVIGFHNIDVNCNGFDGDSILGLNQKPIISSVSFMYSCVIGTAGLSGDGVVDATRAHLNSYYNFSPAADTFLVNAWHSQALVDVFGGIALPNAFGAIMNGLDEPTYFSQSFEITFDSLYFGFITEQSKGSPFATDYDDYAFTIGTQGLISIDVKDIPIFSFKIEIFDAAYSSMLAVYSNDRSQIDTSILLDPGKYYFEVSGASDVYSWQFPYAFKIGFSPSTPVAEEPSQEVPTEYILYQAYPNPFNSQTNIKYTIATRTQVTLKVYDVLGREIAVLVDEDRPAGNYTATWNANGVASGLYFYKITAGAFAQTKKVQLVK